MKYQQLRDYALKCSLEHHLCNVDELINQGKTIYDILAMVGGIDDNGFLVLPIEWENVEPAEAYEYYEPSSLVNKIEDMRGEFVYYFMKVISEVNGEEWATNYKQEVES